MEQILSSPPLGVCERRLDSCLIWTLWRMLPIRRGGRAGGTQWRQVACVSDVTSAILTALGPHGAPQAPDGSLQECRTGEIFKPY